MTTFPGDDPVGQPPATPVAAAEHGPPTRDRRPGAGMLTESRIAAAAVCADLRAGELLDVAYERRAVGLDARDRRWLRELVYGMLRRRAWLDALLSSRVRG